jgi:hypothetical protein
MDRLSRYFIHRLQHLGRRAMIRHAVTNGLIDVKIKEVGGHLLRRYEPAFDVSMLSGDINADLAMIQRRFGVFLRAQGGTKTATKAIDPFDRSGILLRALRVRKDTTSPDDADDAVLDLAAHRAARDQPMRQDRRSYAVSLIGLLAIQPKVTDVAGCLLLARAVDDNRLRLAEISRVFRQPTPIIAVYVLVEGFESVIIRLLEAGAIVPEPMAGAAGEYMYEPDPFNFDEKEATRRFVHFLGGGFHHSSPNTLRKRVGQALDAGHPVIAVAEKMDKIAEHITIAADLSLYSNGLTWPIIVDLLEATTDFDDVTILEACSKRSFEPSLLALDDLALAIRAGRPLPAILDVMETLAERNRASQKTKEATGGKTPPRSVEVKQRTSEVIETNAAERQRQRDAEKNGSAVELILPEDIPIKAEGLPTNGKTVENLVGYGDAKDWALNLKADLALYRDGGLGWSDMSTKLLLSGPPGTGKTLFARALCNSLQIPMLATSVSTWLQGGHLDGVLSRMATSFSEARRQAPCILFIDEIDGIGTRPSPDKPYADYWTAVVNKILELLDGAVKTDGVIVVGATNLPDQIDPAIRRSGRLETHIVIPRPDIEALEDILRHHLRDDIDAVLRPAGGDTAAKGGDDRQTRDNAEGVPEGLPDSHQPIRGEQQ